MKTVKEQNEGYNLEAFEMKLNWLEYLYREVQDYKALVAVSKETQPYNMDELLTDIKSKRSFLLNCLPELKTYDH